jgi:uncharacterized protein YigE (DUF2233 family)
LVSFDISLVVPHSIYILLTPWKPHRMLSDCRKQYALPLLVALCVESLISAGCVEQADAVGVAVPAVPITSGRPAAYGSSKKAAKSSRSVRTRGRRTNSRYSAVLLKKKQRRVARPAAPKKPQEFLDNMAQRTLAPGVVHKVYRGGLYINMIDIDLKNSEYEVRPVMAGEHFSKLDEVKDQAEKVQALAAVNANYFKRDGVPLGTLVIDGEWIAGPIFDRISMGVTRDGQVLMDKMNLHGVIDTSNLDAPRIWVNNINQPRRSGSKLIAYTRRWGNLVRMAYAGTLVAVDAQGKVVDKTTTVVNIPYGGFVLSDSKESPIAKLAAGDQLRMQWSPNPSHWKNVMHAVSGGPVLIQDGKLFVDVKGEHFRKSWTGAQIKARTVLGVTADKHLLLVTCEGPHTLWDLAKFLKKAGCVDAMNLDGGGSTTMVIDGATVTRNRSTYERRVASSLAIVPAGRVVAKADAGEFHNPTTTNLVDFSVQNPVQTVEALPGNYELLSDPEPQTTSVSAAPEPIPAAAPEIAKPAAPPTKMAIDEKPKGFKKYLRWMKMGF